MCCVCNGCSEVHRARAGAAGPPWAAGSTAPCPRLQQRSSAASFTAAFHALKLQRYREAGGVECHQPASWVAGRLQSTQTVRHSRQKADDDAISRLCMPLLLPPQGPDKSAVTAATAACSGMVGRSCWQRQRLLPAVAPLLLLAAVMLLQQCQPASATARSPSLAGPHATGRWLLQESSSEQAEVVDAAAAVVPAVAPWGPIRPCAAAPGSTVASCPSTPGCAVCRPGTNSTTSGLCQCCAAGYQPGGTAARRTCVACAAGAFSKAGDRSCGLCPIGSFSNRTATPNTCTRCPVGFTSVVRGARNCDGARRLPGCNNTCMRRSPTLATLSCHAVLAAACRLLGRSLCRWLWLRACAQCGHLPGVPQGPDLGCRSQEQVCALPHRVDQLGHGPAPVQW